MGMWNGVASGPAAAQGYGPDAGAAQIPPWQAPTDVEHGLYEAKMRGDWATYFDVLAGTRLYHAMSRLRADADLSKVSYSPYWNPGTRTHCLAVLTSGVLPAPAPDPVFFSDSLHTLARDWPWDDHWLAVNPGTPCEAYFPATPAHRAVWQQHAQRVPTNSEGALRTLWVGGPLHGPVAHGLACGALLSVNNRALWNTVGWHGGGYQSERDLLLEWWGIGTREKWLESQEALLHGSMVSAVWEFVLEVRQSIAREYGGAVDLAHWRQVTERVMRHRLDQAARAEPGEEEPGRSVDVEAEIRRVQQLIGRITRYESRFRADGLLGEGRQVRSVLAWDYGRASNMARWGLGARFCDLAETEQAVVRAGRISQVTYKSWEDFSAGFVLGRCLHFDEEEFGNWYEEMLHAHRVLTTDPHSPWLSIPWK
ncbi:DUF1266 domain-containing protein [Streptomyces sp. NPDC004647]|uniref:DUF1266 domain-containing protein n=1 Tax=Streptomyces sp. NPDC004647 TaxID=3154671 RepID=UPI0033B52731